MQGFALRHHVLRNRLLKASAVMNLTAFMNTIILKVIMKALQRLSPKTLSKGSDGDYLTPSSLFCLQCFRPSVVLAWPCKTKEEVCRETTELSFSYSFSIVEIVMSCDPGFPLKSGLLTTFPGCPTTAPSQKPSRTENAATIFVFCLFLSVSLPLFLSFFPCSLSLSLLLSFAALSLSLSPSLCAV